MGLHPWKPEEALPQSSTEVRTAGPSVNLAIQVDNIKVSSAHGLAQARLIVAVEGLVAAEALAGHQAGLSARLLGAGEALSAALVAAVVTLEVSMVVAALEVFTEEATEEAVEGATGKPNGKS